MLPITIVLDSTLKTHYAKCIHLRKKKYLLKFFLFPSHHLMHIKYVILFQGNLTLFLHLKIEHASSEKK